MKLIRHQEKDGFVWYEFKSNTVHLYHYHLDTLLFDILFFTGENLFNFKF